MCFQYTILMCEIYDLWSNKFCMSSIIKSWNIKFMMEVAKVAYVRLHIYIVGLI
jgi:hypothetical protein